MKACLVLLITLSFFRTFADEKPALPTAHTSLPERSKTPRNSP
jgi:hypothetical protein